MKIINQFISLLLVLAVLTGCSKNEARNKLYENQAVTRDVFAMDTYMKVTAYGKNGDTAVDQAVAEIERLELLLSTEKTESEIYGINLHGEGSLSDDTLKILKYSMDIHESTNGMFDITIYPLMKAWGFTTKEYRVPQKEEIRELLSGVDASKIKLNQENRYVALPGNMQIDLGGIAKGYTSQKIMEILKDNGVESGLVSLGGNVQCHGKKPDGSLWKIGIKKPDTSRDYIGILEVSDKAVITSGGYERYFEENGERYHHILNPTTGYPAQSGLTSVSVISQDGTLADALSTALFVMGKEDAVDYWRSHSDRFDMVLVEENGDVTITEGIAKVFTSEEAYQIEKRQTQDG